MDNGNLCCDAFPKGIPVYIIWGYDHREPYPYDNGVRFEIRDDLSELDILVMKARMEREISESRNHEILDHRRKDIEKYLKAKAELKHKSA